MAAQCSTCGKAAKHEPDCPVLLRALAQQFHNGDTVYYTHGVVECEGVVRGVSKDHDGSGRNIPYIVVSADNATGVIYLLPSDLRKKVAA